MGQSRMKHDYPYSTLKGQPPSVLIVEHEGCECFQLPRYGELTIKVSEGKVTFVDITEKHKY